MLGKLFKLEFKNSYRQMLLLYGLTAVLTVIMCFSNMLDNYAPGIADNSIVTIVLGLFGFLYGLSIFVLFGAGFVILCMNFYKTMYSEQGYLTHTLPVSPVATYLTKLAVSLIWMLGASILFLMSIFSLLVTKEQMNPFELVKEMFTHGGELMDLLNKNLAKVLGMNFGSFAWAIIGIGVLALIGAFTYIFFSMTVGQLSSNHKVGVAIATAAGLYLVKQIVSVNVMITSFVDFADNVSRGAEAAPEMVRMVLGFAAAITGGFALVEAVASILIVRKHINLQ